MIRNLTVLGATLVAVFASSPATPTGASSGEEGYLTSDGPVTLDVEELGTPFTGKNALTAFGSSIECPGTTYTGHALDSDDPITVPATTATMTPSYSHECHVSGGRQATIIPNGCDFVLASGDTTPPDNNEDTYGVKVAVVCPVAADGIIVTVRSNTPPAAEGSDVCTLEITGVAGATPINQDVTGAHVTDEGNGHLRLSGTFNNLHVERIGTCVLLGGGTTTNAGQFHIDATVWGTDDEGDPTDISISEIF